MSPVITLTTDFGARDAYAGVMKGVILTRAPEATIIDLTHEIGPQDTLEAAFVFEGAWRFFPAGTVHVVVVDPGVGTNRRRVAIAAGGHFFVGPDNGCLSGALPTTLRGRRRASEAYAASPVRVPPELSVCAIEDESLFLPSVSATFEGRDVFAPVAAYLAHSRGLDRVGPRVEAVEAFPVFRAPATSEGVEGIVLRCDRFGNLITDILAEDIAGASQAAIAGRNVPTVRTYGAGAGLCALAASSGYVEVALPNGSAAAALGIGAGERVFVAKS
jgi:S-adenosylmethionine hydrolase